MRAELLVWVALVVHGCGTQDVLAPAQGKCVMLLALAHAGSAPARVPPRVNGRHGWVNVWVNGERLCAGPLWDAVPVSGLGWAPELFADDGALLGQLIE